ncbi:FAD-binding dehydrogenase [Escherichia coli]
MKARYKKVKINDKSSVFNTDLFCTIELGYMLDVAEAMAHSALQPERVPRFPPASGRRYEERDDVNFLKHTLSFYNQEGAPTIDYSDVKITKSQPAKRVYGSEGEKQDES